MRKKYECPEVIMVKMMFDKLMQSGSDSYRQAGGGITKPGDGGTTVDVEINETETDDGLTDGQGPGGIGTRSKSGMIWDEW